MAADEEDAVQGYVFGQYQVHQGETALNEDAAPSGRRGLQGRAGHGLLAAVDHFQVPDIPPPQLPAHHPGQGTAPGEAQVRDLQAAGVQLVPGTQGGEDGDALVPGPADEVNLAGDQVNGVGDVVQAVKKAVRRLPVVVDGKGMDGAGRVQGEALVGLGEAQHPTVPKIRKQ